MTKFAFNPFTGNFDAVFVATTPSGILLPDGDIIVGDASGVGAAQTPGGDVTMDNTAQFTIISSVLLSGNPTTTTQSPLDNSTRIATTAYTEAAVAVAVAALTISKAGLNVTLRTGWGAITGTLDGANTTLTLPSGYVAGSVNLWYKGQLRVETVETNLVTGVIDTDFGFKAGSEVYVEFIAA